MKNKTYILRADHLMEENLTALTDGFGEEEEIISVTSVQGNVIVTTKITEQRVTPNLLLEEMRKDG